MSEFCQIETTVGSYQEAERIAAELVDRRLAACVQVTGPVISTFRWEGAIETAEEWLCEAKTSTEKFTAVAETIRRLHPYDVPEIIATPILQGNAAYLDWMRDEVS